MIGELTRHVELIWCFWGYKSKLVRRITIYWEYWIYLSFFFFHPTFNELLPIWGICEKNCFHIAPQKTCACSIKTCLVACFGRFRASSYHVLCTYEKHLAVERYFFTSWTGFEFFAIYFWPRWWVSVFSGLKSNTLMGDLPAHSAKRTPSRVST